MGTLSLDKFEALGNDFLVLVDPDGSHEISPSLARALCDRHRGVGADGLIRLATQVSGNLSMELLNADGTAAETSGNGLRCAALAAFRAGLSGRELVIETLAGASRCVVQPGSTPEFAQVRVEMGAVRVCGETSPIASRKAWRVDVGNPHLVLIGAPDGVAIGEIGPRLEWAVPDGQNVELVSARDRTTLDLEVYERGAGLTEACGSGSVAAAAAAWTAGLVESRVVVANPGGELLVELEGEQPHAALTGPTRHVAGVFVELDAYPGVRQ